MIYGGIYVPGTTLAGLLPWPCCPKSNLPSLAIWRISGCLSWLGGKGIKTATCSLLYWYDVEGEDLPKVGQYDIVLNSREEAVAVIRTTQVFVTPFNQVSADHAYQEGEGDRSLAYWRQVHRDFFSRELTEVGVSFSSEMLLVCEVFECVYSIANCNSD